MALNVYEFEERISFDPSRPDSYYGWYVSTSSSCDKAALFDTKADRQAFEAYVKELTGNDDWRVPGLLLCAYCDNDGAAWWELELTDNADLEVEDQHRALIWTELANYSANADGSVYEWGKLTETENSDDLESQSS